jgi:hypothetical protein
MSFFRNPILITAALIAIAFVGSAFYNGLTKKSSIVPLDPYSWNSPNRWKHDNSLAGTELEDAAGLRLPFESNKESIRDLLPPKYAVLDEEATPLSDNEALIKSYMLGSRDPTADKYADLAGRTSTVNMPWSDEGAPMMFRWIEDYITEHGHRPLKDEIVAEFPLYQDLTDLVGTDAFLLFDDHVREEVLGVCKNTTGNGSQDRYFVYKPLTYWENYTTCFLKACQSFT